MSLYRVSRRATLLVAAVLVFALGNPIAGLAQSAKLTLLHINDVYEISPKGGIGGLAPERRSDLARFGLRAVLGGTLATMMTATIAGVLTTIA